jgi:hypothetical protein
MAFCPWCGTGIDKPACTVCATPLLGAWTHCPSCGTAAARSSVHQIAGRVPLEMPNGRVTGLYED